jgi:xanthine dehydrogenase YagT iron-sulfur-binding subunit
MTENEKKTKGPQVSRRTFLKGVGAGAVIGGAVVAGVEELRIAQLGPAPSAQPTATTTAAGAPSGLSVVTLNVNGKDYTLDVDNRATLADTIRHKLNLIGTKAGCDRGECGACAVLVDDVPMLSCMMLAVEAQGKKITTVEGIGGPGNESNIQASLADNDGVQCGACMPGMVVVSTAFLKQNPNPTDADLRAALAGNLCRCGNYDNILQGLKAVK